MAKVKAGPQTARLITLNDTDGKAYDIVPTAEERQRVHAIIFDELCRDVVTDASRQDYLAIMRNLVAQGAEGIILGCTEIGMLIAPQDFPDAPLFDTTILHAQKAVNLCVEREPLPIRPL